MHIYTYEDTQTYIHIYRVCIYLLLICSALKSLPGSLLNIHIYIYPMKPTAFGVETAARPLLQQS